MNNLISKEIKYEGIRFKVIQKIYERADGKKYVRDCVEPGDAVIILAVDKNENIIFIKQYREVVENLELQLPAGIIEKGESPKETAIRELEEETGLKAKSIEYLTSCYPSMGYTREKIYIYVAKDLEMGKQHLDETEEILSVEKIPVEECMKLLLDDKINDATVYVAVQTYYYKYYNGGKNG